jgi:hypothetical protein
MAAKYRAELAAARRHCREGSRAAGIADWLPSPALSMSLSRSRATRAFAGLITAQNMAGSFPVPRCPGAEILNDSDTEYSDLRTHPVHLDSVIRVSDLFRHFSLYEPASQPGNTTT